MTTYRLQASRSRHENAVVSPTHLVLRKTTVDRLFCSLLEEDRVRLDNEKAHLYRYIRQGDMLIKQVSRKRD